MRMLIHVKIPHEPFNSAVRDGSAGKTLERILAETKPEAVYFTEYDGRRGAIMIVDIADPSRIPALAEPWFLSFNAVDSRSTAIWRLEAPSRVPLSFATSGE